MTDVALNKKLQGKLVWQPKNPQETRIEELRRKVAQREGVELHDYHAFWQWSVDNPAKFWQTVWDETGVISSSQATEVLPPDAPMYPPPQWFKGAKLNLAENLLRHRGSQLSIIEASEHGDVGRYTRDEVYAQVSQAVQAFRARGLRPGERVAAYAPNCMATLVAFLATSACGGVWVSCGADFGAEGVIERLCTLQPRFLITCDAVRYNGRPHAHAGKVHQVLEALKKEKDWKLEEIIEIQYVGGIDLVEGATSWSSFLSAHAASDKIAFEQMDFDAPCWVLFSSGTTAKPKAITHRAGGMLLQLSKEHLIHGGLGETDVFFQFSTVGWMMWNFCIAALVAGCPVVLYDGSPLKPPSVLWDLTERHGVTVFGTSAAYLAALQKSGYTPKAAHPNLKVKQVLSTGSPLRADLYPWILEAVGDVLIGSITGGSDICSLFAGHNVALPVRAGEIQARNLGMNIDVFDDEGKPVRGREGELVCKTPFPAQPLGFWGQPEERYFDAYYAHFPGVWYHGDFVHLSDAGGLVMCGRSDNVLNPGGIRFGSSEIYEVLEAHKAAPPLADVDSYVVCALKTPAGDDEVVVLLLVLAEGASSGASEEQWSTLEEAIKKLVKAERGPRYVPRFVKQVKGVPLTINGKLSEVPVKRLLNGNELSSINASTLSNPQVLPEYVTLGATLRAQLREEMGAK